MGEVRDGSNQREQARRHGTTVTADFGGSGGALAMVVDQRKGARGLLTRLGKKRKWRRERKGTAAPGQPFYTSARRWGMDRRQGVGEGPGGPGRRYRPAAARPRWEPAGGACTCGRCRIGERRGLTGGPAAVPGGAVKYGLNRFKNSNCFKNIKKIQILTDPNLTFPSSKKLE
jgi:hypothetical protein